MLVKFLNAHSYRGNRTDHPKHPATPRRRYMPGDLADIPVGYFERHLEPYKFAQIHNPTAVAEGAAAALMEDMTVEQLRGLIEKHKLDDKIEGSGPNGRAMKEDLVTILDAYYRSVGRVSSDEDEIPADDELARIRAAELVTLCEAQGLDVKGSGHDGKVLKADMVKALIEHRALKEGEPEYDELAD